VSASTWQGSGCRERAVWGAEGPWPPRAVAVGRATGPAARRAVLVKVWGDRWPWTSEGARDDAGSVAFSGLNISIVLVGDTKNKIHRFWKEN